MRKRIIPVVLMSLSIVAAACGSDDEAASTTAPAESTAPDETTAATTADTAVAGSDTTVAGGTGECTLDTPLKIGFAADLGELGAFSDGPGSEAAQVMVDILNDAGGVGGLPVEYVIKDIQGDPAATQRAAQELLDEGVNAIIGPPFASTGAPLLDAVDGQAPVIYMASTDPALADPSRGAFLASFSDQVQSAAIAEWALAQGHTTAVTLSSTDDVYFSGNPEYFTTVFEEGGGTVAGDYAYSLADADFSTQVNEIAALSEPPAVLFTAMVMPQTQVLLEQLDAAGLGDVIVTGVDGFDASVVWSAGDVAEGVVFAAHTFPQDGNGVEQFLADAAAAGANIETISFGALAADAVQIIAAAATEACSVDGATLITTIDGLVNVPVTTGTVTYAGTGGVPEKDVVILEVKDGQPTFVEAVRPTNIPS
ncbi:MAG: ABC transporter substrate-binding protein [Acidimicrobiaceae bacterium]|jgi:branched-chain amino acid transport system substrate-binding protein|nr:ABC transporter substrate-binding protein [Acidimicrobiaceae bacterium]MBP7888133.1 ABC transporter substrate-binding protein [Ilumatobacteraceae bacterium]HQY13312.1 ABC transporter substrate-binding protein [Ilumatobacteraceae bacterium]HRA83495.1 ABC transporter substrate-binding protein [Ilumatobacteraceae bacterium]HRC45741.1 ABC transporter substrate-binding protein [Ilumatobacteraceae bacterium]